MVGKIRSGAKAALRTEKAGAKSKDTSLTNGTCKAETLDVPPALQALLIKRLSKIDRDLARISIEKKRDVFVKLSLEQHFGSDFVLSQQYETVHKRVMDNLCETKGVGALDVLLKKLG
ncbi:hypothetical protein A9Q99_08115 [Gammaproteobacteria bacterium 45_16_T64]|nr:hypothetical protein A9Q99_08115 [Gammaproteobacteria bacterium 45_16_T64]